MGPLKLTSLGACGRACQCRARNPRSPSPSPSPICPGMGMGVPSPICRGSGIIPIPIPDLPESGIKLSTIEYPKGVEFRLPQCLTLRLIVLPIKLVHLRRPAMSDDAVDYSGTSDSDSESDKVPSRLPARAESCILAHDLPSTPLASIGAGQMARKTTPCGRVCPSRLTRTSTILVYS